MIRAICKACSWSRVCLDADDVPDECDLCRCPYFNYATIAADVWVTASEPALRSVFCRWSDCLHEVRHETPERPAACPFCLRGAQWSTIPPTPSTIIEAKPRASRPYRIGWSDEFILHGLKIDPEQTTPADSTEPIRCVAQHHPAAD